MTTHISPSLNVNITATGSLDLAAATSSIVAIVATSTDDDVEQQAVIDSYFTANTPVLVTNYSEAFEKCGSNGTLKNVLKFLGLVSAPRLIVVRVVGEASTPTDEEISAAIEEIKQSRQLLGMTPDYLGAPGLESAVACNKLDLLGDEIDAVPYVSIPADSISEAMSFWNALTGTGKIKGCWPDFTDFTGSAAAMMLAIRAKITAKGTNLYGPHKTIGNVELPLVTGLAKTVYFDPSGTTGDVKTLNEAGITTMVYFDGAWRFWGDEMRGGDGREQFENVLLVDLWMKKQLQQSELKFLSFGLSKSFIKNVIADVETKYRAIQSNGWIVGYKVSWSGDKNTATSLGAGKWVISAKHTVVSPAGTGVFEIESTDEFYSTLSDDLTA